MKRGVVCFVLAAFFALPALAAAEVNGVYVAPRFLVGIQDSGQLSRTNTRWLDGAQMVDQYSQVVFGGALALGYNFGPKFNVPIRAEVEYAMRSNAGNNKDGSSAGGSWWNTKQTMNVSTLFFNGYFDIPTGTPFTPYIGGGLGMAFNYTQVKAEGFEPGGGAPWSENKSRYDTTFAWNAGAGLSYAFTEHVSADLGYRFIGAGNREVKLGDTKVSSTPYINEFYLGGRFTF